MDKKSQVTFMNYGFSSKGHEISLEPADMPNLYPAKLYNYLVTKIDISGKSLMGWLRSWWWLVVCKPLSETRVGYRCGSQR